MTNQEAKTISKYIKRSIVLNDKIFLNEERMLWVDYCGLGKEKLNKTIILIPNTHDMLKLLMKSRIDIKFNWKDKELQLYINDYELFYFEDDNIDQSLIKAVLWCIKKEYI